MEDTEEEGPPRKLPRSLNPESVSPQKKENESPRELINNPTNSLTSRDYYFDSYSHHGIHEEMLKDQIRTRTYQKAILDNPHLFRDKIVLDVGCGTGILSMFAAQAGAKHVYAVDCSSIIDYAKIIVDKNGFSDRITVIKGAIEEVELPSPPGLSLENNVKYENGEPTHFLKHVDIIISEWMGYFLLYESMLKTVIYAREKWLVPGGLILPDKATLYICAAEDTRGKSERIDFWSNVYNFDMSVLKDVALREAIVDVIEAEAICTAAVPIHHIDVLTCTQDALSFNSTFTLCASRNDYVHGLVVFFECAFTQIHKPIGFSTSPFAHYTHWKQTIFYLENSLTICKGESMDGILTCRPNANNNRDLDIDISVHLEGKLCQYNGAAITYRLR